MDKKKVTLISMLCVSLVGNIILTGINFRPINKQTLNISDIPWNITCLMESNRYLIKNHVYGHVCYNPWLDLSIIDLRYYSNGKLNLNNTSFLLPRN